MKWKCYPLPDDDPKAKKKFLENVEYVAGTQTLARKLLPRLRAASGPMFLVAQDFLDCENIKDYRWAGTYSGGKLLHDVVEAPTIPVGDQSGDGMAEFISEYVRRSVDRIVLVSARGHSRDSLKHWRLAELRYGFFCEDAYPILTRLDVDNAELMREPARIGIQWTTGLCSRIVDLPPALPLDNMLDEPSLEAVVANTVHLFTSALDDEGYLVWCIGAESDRRFFRGFLKSVTLRRGGTVLD